MHPTCDIEPLLAHLLHLAGAAAPDVPGDRSPEEYNTYLVTEYMHPALEELAPIANTLSGG